MTRPLVPRAPTAVAPAMVSQLTSMAILGLDERRFLEQLVPRCRSVAHVGRLRVVEVEEAVRVLRDLAPTEATGEEASEVPREEGDESGDFSSVDAVLRKLGRVRTKGATE